MQGLSVPFACVGSGDPVRVLRLYTMNTLDILEAFIAETYVQLAATGANVLRARTLHCYCCSYESAANHSLMTDCLTKTNLLALYCAVLYIPLA